jgi:hypothetical protein
MDGKIKKFLDQSGWFCYNSGRSAPLNRLHRLGDQDEALSRLRPEFESPWRHTEQSKEGFCCGLSVTKTFLFFQNLTKLFVAQNQGSVYYFSVSIYIFIIREQV